MADNSVLVTGVTGVIGRALQRSSDRIIGIARREAAGCLHVDLADARAVAQLLDDRAPSAIIHAVGVSRGSDDDFSRVNIGLLRPLLEQAALRHLRVVVVGSAAEYGDPGTARPISETTPVRPLSSYGNSKLVATELALQSYAEGLPITVARVFNVVSNSGSVSSPIADFVQTLRTFTAGTGSISVGNAQVIRDFTTDAFVARALLALADADASQPIVNICSGVGTSFAEFITALASQLRVHVTIESRGESAIMAVVGDAERLHRLTGLQADTRVMQLAAHALASPTNNSPRDPA